MNLSFDPWRSGDYKLFLHWDSAQVASENSTFVWSFISRLDPMDRQRARDS